LKRSRGIHGVGIVRFVTRARAGRALAVAVLCNAASVPAVQYAMQLLDSLMGPR